MNDETTIPKTASNQTYSGREQKIKRCVIHIHRFSPTPDLYKSNSLEVIYTSFKLHDTLNGQFRVLVFLCLLLSAQFHPKSALKFANDLLVWNGFSGFIFLYNLWLLINQLKQNPTSFSYQDKKNLSPISNV